MRRNVILFFIVAFSFTWAMWIPAVVLAQAAGEETAPGRVLRVVGSYGPSLTAVGFVAMRRKAPTAGQFLRRVVRLSGAPWLWVFAVLFVPVAVGFGYLVNGVATGNWPIPVFVADPLYLPMGILYVLALGGPLGEELGWRGYALDRLVVVMSPFRASILIGIIWTVWHVPLYLIPGSTQQQFPFVLYMLFTTMQAVVYTVLYLRARRSILIAILYHLFSNLALGLFPTLSLPLGLPVFAVILSAGVLSVILANRRTLFTVPARR